MKNWDQAYKEKGVIQSEVLDLVSDAVKIFKKEKVKKVLDLGFGTGRHTIFLAKNGFQVYGIDVSKEGLKITKKRSEEKGLNAKLCIADMHKLPYRGNFFNGIIAVYVIEHNTYNGLLKSLSEVRRVLKPGGIFATTLLTKNDYKFGIGEEIEPGTFINSKDPIESEVPHRFSTREEVDFLFAEYEVVSIEEKKELESIISPGNTNCRWNIIVKK